MYTESFGGDNFNIDEFVAASFTLGPFRLPGAIGRADTYGLAKNQRDALAGALLTIGREMMSNPETYVRGIVEIDAHSRITITHWYQAANLYQTVGRNDWFAGLAGEKAKPQRKRYTR